MRIILLLIILSLIVAIGFLFAFFWAVRNGQYDDDVTPSMRILLEEDMVIKADNILINNPSAPVLKLENNEDN